MSKADRQHALARLLRDRDVASQAQLLERLRAEGFEATQATVSRDLEDLGAVKVRGTGGQLVYALPDDEPVADEAEVRQILRRSLLGATPSGNLIVLRTPTAHAQVVADTLDRSGLPGVIGTIAGDDTVLVICDDRTPSRLLTRRLLSMAGVDTPRTLPTATAEPSGGGGRTGPRSRRAG